MAKDRGRLPPLRDGSVGEPRYPMRIVEVSQVELSPSTGMGRVALSWFDAFRRAGHSIEHVGPTEVGPLHPARFARAARRWVVRRELRPDLVLAHEPAASVFLRDEAPVVVFSHGIERRGWEVGLAWSQVSGERASLKSRMLFPIWRLRPCDRALRRARHVLVLNRDDQQFCVDRYGRAPEEVSVIRNGVDLDERSQTGPTATPPVALFIGSWLPRKGVRVLARAADALEKQGLEVRWLLAGTGLDRASVLAQWPEALREVTEVVPEFSREQEAGLFARASLFVLPSFFEGQPLALLQALAAGVCCIATDTCGHRDLVQDGGSGLLVEPGDGKSLSAALAQAVVDPGLREALGSAGRRTMRGRSWAETSDEVVRIIGAALGRRSDA